MKSWTPEQTNLLRSNYNLLSNSELLSLFPSKTKQAIYKKAYKMGLRKTDEITFRNRSEANKGKSSGRYNGGRRRTAKGYIQIFMPSHPRADPSGYVFEHIVVFEQNTGISVPPNCCVHHLNGDKACNRIENLCLMERGAHTAFHHEGCKHTQETKQKISESRKKHVE